MSDITASTTAAELVTAFGFSSLAQMEAYLKRRSTKGSGSKSSDADVVEMAEKVFAIIEKRGSTAQPWKSGILTTLVSEGELVKANDFDPELKRRRYAMHALIGKALKHLHAEGVLEKPKVKSAAHTHYKMVAGAQFGSKVEPETLGLPGPVAETQEEIIDVEIVEEPQVPAAPKPKARVRKAKGKKK
jgi:hypothetical protein